MNGILRMNLSNSLERTIEIGFIIACNNAIKTSAIPICGAFFNQSKPKPF
jgi:hypothetical protein